MTKTKDVTLGFLANGGPGELFEDALAKVIANIRDPNTSAKAKRKITVELTLTPSKDRAHVGLSTKVTPKLAPAEPYAQAIHIGKRDGQLVAVGFDPGQLDALEEAGVADPSVTPLRPESKEAKG